MKNSLGKIVTGKDSFGGLESGMPMNSLLQVSQLELQLSFSSEL